MIIIIGAGLSGLLTAYHLQKEGLPFKILEARNRIGGRINTIYGTNNTPIEMGATWFTHQHTHLITLLEGLEIECFEQYIDGTVFYQPLATSPPQRVQIPNSPPSYRISGGTYNLINTLFQKLDATNVLLNQSVTAINIHKNGVIVQAKEAFKGTGVVLAIPPKLWANKIVFEPQLSSELMIIAKHTHTWMEDAIKIALTYKQPFWQQKKLPTTLFSNTGPITELYDHCNHDRSKYALCGFINSSFKTLSYTERRASVLNQLTAVFGVKATAFIDYEECIWSKEENTFEASDIFLYPHQNNGNAIFNTSLFDAKLFISSAESASEFPGYMEGAVYSANVTAKKIMKGQ
jgi:monoamine oxidase